MPVFPLHSSSSIQLRQRALLLPRALPLIDKIGARAQTAHVHTLYWLDLSRDNDEYAKKILLFLVNNKKINYIVNTCNNSMKNLMLM